MSDQIHLGQNSSLYVFRAEMITSTTQNYTLLEGLPSHQLKMGSVTPKNVFFGGCLTKRTGCFLWLGLMVVVRISQTDSGLCSVQNKQALDGL